MQCPLCSEEVDELVSLRAGGKRTRACEDCASKLREDAEIADEATTAMQGMMEYKGGRK
jgi:ribosome-binding protein aMBF1 (putative translation factor)